MTEATYPPDRPVNRILRLSVLPMFIIGSFFLLLAGYRTFPYNVFPYYVGFAGTAIGFPLVIAGISIILAGVCISFIRPRDYKKIFHRLSSGSALVLGVAAMSITAIDIQDSHFGFGEMYCCMSMVCIALVLLIVAALSARKKHPKMEMVISLMLIIGFIFVFPNVVRFLPNVLNGTHEIPTENGTSVDPTLPWTLAEAILYCGLFFTALGALAVDYVRAQDEKLDIREREYLNARMKEKQLKR